MKQDIVDMKAKIKFSVLTISYIILFCGIITPILASKTINLQIGGDVSYVATAKYDVAISNELSYTLYIKNGNEITSIPSGGQKSLTGEVIAISRNPDGSVDNEEIFDLAGESEIVGFIPGGTIIIDVDGKRMCAFHGDGSNGYGRIIKLVKDCYIRIYMF